MVKPKKHILAFEDEFDYEIVGLCTHHNDYRLAWSINETMGLKLKKCDDEYLLTDKKGVVVSSHSMYEYADPIDRLTYYLLKNKSKGKYLIHEKPSIDYFLFLCDNHAFELDEFVERIKSTPSILAAFPFSIDEVRSAENLVFN